MTAQGVAVVVLGFFGSIPKNLEPAVQMWQAILGEHGMVRAFAAQDAMPSLSSTREIEEAIEGYNRVILHLFSNRGAFQYLALSLRGSLRGKVIGLVLDSSPGTLSALSFVRAVAANSTKRPLFRLSLFLAPPLLAFLVAMRQRRGGVLAVVVHLALVQLASELISMPFLRFFSSWDPSKAPSLFIFSQQDSLILAETVREVARKRQQVMIGSPVTLEEMHGSAHVRHIFTFPDQYQEALRKFYLSVL